MECYVVDTTRSPYARLKPVPINRVLITDNFWKPRLELLRRVTLKEQYRFLEETGRLDNFRVVAGKGGVFRWRIADDSDVYKWLEAVAYTIAYQPDEELIELANSVINDIKNAQEQDGYLFTYQQFYKEKYKRWENLRDMHELYCAGHLIQAAIAHFRATGKDDFLKVAIKLADCIYNTFGPNKRLGVPGHPEIEMALVELFRVTHKEKYLSLAEFFINNRGKGLIGGSVYHIDHVPFRKLKEIVGHAVRALYLNCGATDIYMETGDLSLFKTLERLWHNMTSRKMYITGGVGSRYEGEAFGDDYELPNYRAYAETCAAIANFMWNWRMLLATGECKYADVMELALYNGILSGISLDGKRYFYVNPLADRGARRRQPWFSCACCPTNIVRLLASLPGYLFTTSKEGVWVHLYIGSKVRISPDNTHSINLELYTEYPWKGDIELYIDTDISLMFTLYLRIPFWCDEGDIIVNGKSLNERIIPGSYFKIRRVWKRGDRVQLHLPMRTKMIVSHPFVLNNSCRISLMRGPIVYCFEYEDNKDFDVWCLAIPISTTIKAQYEPNLLNGVVTLLGEGYVVNHKTWNDNLYLPLDKVKMEFKKVKFKAIPYFAWANRGIGPMIVWVRLLS